ncbi:DUF6629 family protein [Kitasatospora sp. NPDC048540]|uniref:DUF6629 family protein n=1 Tax=Kitasatospora sp. NPDC048540 TaxID=3155634 RepID=UPI003408DE2D
MCWSAEADAVAGTVVAALGVACLARVRDPRQLPLAVLPLLLGLHQLIEAVVWLGADGRIGQSAAAAARVAWTVIALPLLPVLVSAGVRCAARPRTALQLLLVGVGCAVSVASAIALATRPVTVRVDGHVLAYAVGVPGAGLLLVGYLAATVGALLASGDRLLRLLGVLVGGGAVVCALVWRLAFVSTWCALAAVAALVLLRWVRDARPGAVPARERP